MLHMKVAENIPTIPTIPTLYMVSLLVWTDLPMPRTPRSEHQRRTEIARIFATGLLRLHQHHLLDLPNSSEQLANGVDRAPETSVTVLPASEPKLSPTKGARP